MPNNRNDWLSDPWIERILRALDGLEYGSVQIIVHDSKITQIERTEKQRFPLERLSQATGRTDTKSERK